MKRRTILAMLLAALAALSPHPAIAASRWLKAETRNFEIYSSGGRAQLEQFARKVEQFDALLRHVNQIGDKEVHNRLPIYLLGTSEGVADLIGEANIAGFYRPSRYGSFAVANRERADGKFDLSADAVLFHEYAHHFMFHHFAYAYPAWYVEGFAEYVSTAEFPESGGWTLGKPPYFRAAGLVLGRDLPIDKLLFGRPASLDRALREVYYGRAWLLVHYLRNAPARKGQLDAYLRALGAGKPERDAAQAAFGELGRLDKDLDGYLQSKRLSYLQGGKPLDYAREPAVAELDDADSRLLRLGLRRRVGRDLARTRDQLAALAAQAPGRAPVWLELALAEYDLAAAAGTDAAKASGRVAAEAAVDKALAAERRLGRANLLKARLLMDRLDQDDDPAQWKAARDHIARANRAATLDPAPLFTWHESFLRQGVEPDELASDGLALAHTLAPEALDLRVQYAFDLARQQRFDEALRVVEFVVRDPHGAERGAELVARLQAMRAAAVSAGRAMAD